MKKLLTLMIAVFSVIDADGRRMIPAYKVVYKLFRGLLQYQAINSIL
jgi:hypothetical protein